MAERVSEICQARRFELARVVPGIARVVLNDIRG
jgi:hypothetical protein